MKVGSKVSYYTSRTAWVPSMGREKEYVKQFTGTVVRFNDPICEILPDGKTKTIVMVRDKVTEI